MTFLNIWTQRAAKSEKRIKTYEDFIIQKKNREKLKQTTSKDIAAESAPGSSRERPFEDISSRERVEDSKKLAISVGGQSAKPLGMRVGSRIKRHLRYGGTQKQDNHTHCITVIITNGNNTSQTCVYCFHKLQHLKQLIQAKDKTANGLNINARDKLSALAIAISGITTLLFQQTLPAFSRTISHFNIGFDHKRHPLVHEAEEDEDEETLLYKAVKEGQE
ncbi:hypothetical protein BD560DRAFT_443026 [Blakeslea trispora]|nr:hypothetical protein BD560DRAFT_443026 [Blakeslea trispora]